MQEYVIWFCETTKERVLERDSYQSRRKWLWDVRRMPYRVIDRDGHNIWLDVKAA